MIRCETMWRGAALAALLCVMAAAPALAVDAASNTDAVRDGAERLIGAALASDRAQTRLSELCDGIGHRLSGSAAFERAAEWGAASMRADGLDSVWLQPVMVPHWERGAEHAALVTPRAQPLSMLGLGGSIATPKGGITAEVVTVRSFAHLDSLPDSAVRGKIVLFDVPYISYGQTVRYRGLGANAASRRGAVAMLLRSVGPVSLRTPHTGQMRPYVDSIPAIPAAAITIEDATMLHRLCDRGQHPTVHLEMSARKLPDVRSANVIGELRGREHPEEIVAVGGHLDSWDVGAGAHDDGGGCIISMEAARLIRALGLRPRRTVRVVLWVNEENGTRGAHAYADSAFAKGELHVAAMESDGGVERPTGFGVTVNTPGGEAVDSVRTARALARIQALRPLFAGLGADQMVDQGGDTDTGPLMARGIPGVAHRTTMEHYFDWHHTPADTPDKVDPVELRKNVAAMAAMVWSLAEMPERLGD